MNVKEFTKKEKSTAEIAMTVDAGEFEAAVQKAYLKQRGRISVPGFRKGKAPRKIIESMYGSGVFYEDAIDIIAPDALKKGVEDEKLDTVGRPSILDFSVEEDKSLTIKFLVSLYPEVKLGQYKGIAAEKRPAEVTDEDVERELESIRARNARIESVEREAKTGDIVNIDFEGFVNGIPFEGGKGDGHDLELGSGQFIPGFEDQLVGAKAGDNVDVKVTFPENYEPSLAGKNATFKVVVNEVKEKQLPELDDEFARDVSEFDTLDEYKADVKANLLKSREENMKRAFENNVLDKLVESIEVEIPEAMIDEQVEQGIENFRYNLAGQGLTLEQYVSMMGMNIESFKTMSRPGAEKQIKADLAFEAIAKAEDFSVSDEEVEAEYKNLAERYRMDLDKVKAAITADAVKTGLKIDAAHKLVYDSAIPEEPKDEAEKAE